MNHFFICYSSVDGYSFSLKLADTLAAGPPSIPVWLDKRELRSGEDWDEQLVDAIRTCKGLLFVMTKDSVQADSVCKDEWVLALTYKKPVIPLQLHPEAKLPFRLGSRQTTDFIGSFDTGIARLRSHLLWMDSPEGVLKGLQQRLADARRQLPRVEPHHQQRIQDEMEELEGRIVKQQYVVDYPDEGRKSAKARIEDNFERERQTSRETGSRDRPRFINNPPAAPPSWFQNRHVETALVGKCLQEEGVRLMTVVGRAGVGKTAMICRLLKALERGRLPDDGERIEVDGVVYLGPTGSRHVRFPDLYADLCRLLPEAQAQLLDRISTNPQAKPRSIMQTLLENFPHDRTIVLLDNFEDVLDKTTGEINDDELNQALHAILEAPQHAVKFILTTRVAPRELLLAHPERQMLLKLEEGLASPYAENILRAMDNDGTLGLKEAPDELLDEARQRTRGYPRALEALVAILRVDSDTTLEEILENAQQFLPDNVVKKLVGEAFSRLDPTMQQVMQALAIYPSPVPPMAVDYLLQPHCPGIDSEPLLKLLISMQFARREAGHCYLHPVDREYALSRIPEGTCDDWQEEKPPTFTRTSLFRRAADYFRKIRPEEADWHSFEDLSPMLVEFELLVSSADFHSALEVLRAALLYLEKWGHSRLILRLADRLSEQAQEPVRTSAAGLAGLAASSLGENAQAMRYLKSALVAPPAEINGEEILSWQLTLADILLSHGNHQEATANYRAAKEQADEDDIESQASALLGLGSVAAAKNEHQEAREQYHQALHFLATRSAVELIPEDDAFSINGAELPPGIQLSDPRDWFPISLETEGEDLVALFGVAMPQEELPEDDKTRTTATHDEEEGNQEEVDVMLLLASSALADIWLSFARLYWRTDRLSDAAASCQLALQIYGVLELDLGVAQALELLGRLAADLPEADAEVILEIQEEELNRARKTKHRRLEMTLLDNLAESYLERNRKDDAERLYGDLLHHAAELDDSGLKMRAERGMALINWNRGNTDEAVAKLQALLAERLEDLEFQSDTEMMLGDFEFARDRRESAVKHYMSAGRGYAGLAWLQGQVAIEQKLAGVASDQRNYEEAVRRLDQALPAAREMGIASVTTSLLCALAEACLSAGSRKRALAVAREAYQLTSEIELLSAQAETLVTLGRILERLKQYEDAEAMLKEARKLFQDSNDTSGEINALIQLARLYDKTEQRNEEINAAQTAWKLAQQTGSQAEMRDARTELALALSDGGHHVQAIGHMKEVVQDNPDRGGYYLGTLGWVCFQADEYDQCLKASLHALELDPAQTWVIRNLGHAYLAKGQPDEAEREYRRAIKDRKGGEDFVDTIREIKNLLTRKPDLARGTEMLHLMEEEQAMLNDSEL